MFIIHEKVQKNRNRSLLLDAETNQPTPIGMLSRYSLQENNPRLRLERQRVQFSFIGICE